MIDTPAVRARGEGSSRRRAEQALEGADALVIVTEWREFRSPDFKELKARLRDPVIFDGRNLYDPDYLGQLGFSYYGIGRGTGDRGY